MSLFVAFVASVDALWSSGTFTTSSDSRVLVQVWQVAGVVRLTLALLLGYGNHWASVLATICRSYHLFLGLALKHDLKRVVRVDATQFRIVAQHLGCDLGCDAILSRRLDLG